STNPKRGGWPKGALVFFEPASAPAWRRSQARARSRGIIQMIMRAGISKPAGVVRVATLALTLTSTWPLAAWAQERAPRDSSVLEEVTVTAQKREERLQDVPIAV